MISLVFFLFWFMFTIYYLNFFSFLNCLLILESLSLLIFFCFVYISFCNFSLSMVMYYFVFIVCESAMGLSILVKIVKFYGSVNYKSMSFLMF